MIQHYLKIAFRHVWRHKRYSVINILGLAVSLAAFWVIVLYVTDELSYDRYNTHADHIVRVAQHASWNGGKIDMALTSAPFADILKENYPEVDDAVRIDMEGGGIISYSGKKIKADDLIFADPSLFKIFTYQFLKGNATSALSTPQGIVLTRDLAEKLFGPLDNALGRTIYFDNNDGYKVTAIIEDIPQNSQLRFSGVRLLPTEPSMEWQNAHLYTYLLLHKGTDYRVLEKKITQFANNFLKKELSVTSYHLELQPLLSIHLHSQLQYEISSNGSITVVYIFIGIGLLILLIAIINYVNLSSALGMTRIREIGVRRIVGSNKREMIFLFITESVIITMMAMFLAIFIVALAMPSFNLLSGKDLSIWRFGIPLSIASLILLSLAIGILNGLYPALFLSRFQPVPALKGLIGNRARSQAFRKSLMIFQFVVTMVLICGSFVIYQQLRYLRNADLGFNKDQVLTFHVDDMQVRQKITALKAQLLQSPFIKGVAAAGNPIGNNDLGKFGYLYEQNDGTMADHTQMAEELIVDPDFLNTMEISLAAGRNLSRKHGTDSSNAVLINQSMVKALGWSHPIGKQIIKAENNSDKATPQTVVGVVKDFHTYSLQYKVSPLVMKMPTHDYEGDNVYVRLTAGKVNEGLAYLKKVYAQFDPSDPVTYHFLDENFSRQYEAEDRQGVIAGIFTALSIFIACLGLFGMVAFHTERRTKEIGVRKVLGATIFTIMRIISVDFLALVGSASLIAIPVAWWLMRKWLQNFAYRVNMPWWAFLVSAVTVLLIALLTISIQAFRAASTNPIESLRTE